ncbi:uncharacterized protein K02A2.6-like [Anastrepha ludens]|uniref:uncharacterized protein K02A2.6-like n=1 Tax=Anastrepha ludens TaxID=28586 RepID=UPI0023AE8C62|nr:uncharacterized protein K02A2.6-like [Anastrepha ludens]
MEKAKLRSALYGDHQSVSLQIDSAVPPVRLPPPRIPFAIKGIAEEEINRLCCQGILEPVEYSDWATPIVPVAKRDGSIRICGDYKSTLNKAIKTHCHQIPAVSTLSASIEGGSIYANIDLAQAYQLLMVDERSSLLQTVSTHKGAFKVTRLQFGISSAPGLFQSCIENVLQSIRGVLPYIDDIVVIGKSEDELANKLEQIFVRFDKAGRRLRKDKFQFSVPSIEFLGFKLDNLGIRPSPDKIKAMHEAPPPKDKKQLQAFLDVSTNKNLSAMNYYAYRMMIRTHEENVIQKCRRLFQQFAVDMYVKVETESLAFIRFNQAKLRSEDYIHLRDAIHSDGNVQNIGRLTILSSPYIESPRHMHECAMVHVRNYGVPDLLFSLLKK